MLVIIYYLYFLSEKKIIRCAKHFNKIFKTEFGNKSKCPLLYKTVFITVLGIVLYKSIDYHKFKRRAGQGGYF